MHLSSVSFVSSLKASSTRSQFHTSLAKASKSLDIACSLGDTFPVSFGAALRNLRGLQLCFFSGNLSAHDFDRFERELNRLFPTRREELDMIRTLKIRCTLLKKSMIL
jgi:hypothetical protein